MDQDQTKNTHTCLLIQCLSGFNNLLPNVLFWQYLAGGGVPGHAGEQRTRGLRAGGSERDGPVLFCADSKTAACQVELSDVDFSTVLISEWWHVILVESATVWGFGSTRSFLFKKPSQADCLLLELGPLILLCMQVTGACQEGTRPRVQRSLNQRQLRTH